MVSLHSHNACRLSYIIKEKYWFPIRYSEDRFECFIHVNVSIFIHNINVSDLVLRHNKCVFFCVAQNIQYHEQYVDPPFKLRNVLSITASNICGKVMYNGIQSSLYNNISQYQTKKSHKGQLDGRAYTFLNILAKMIEISSVNVKR